jgi:DNA-binding transcriptional ArsR family regulator
MDHLIRDFEQYLSEVLRIASNPRKWEGEKTLPYLLRDLYEFYQAHLLDTSCLLMVARDESSQTPVAVRKHLALVSKNWDGEVVYVQKSVSAYNRKRLIEQKVPFVIPGNQMFLSALGIDLREHFRRSIGTSSHVSPSTQVVVLYAILRTTTETLTPSRLAKLLGYTRMTLTRALDELQATGLGTVEIRGRERILRFVDDGQTLWEHARIFLTSPVKKRLWIQRLHGNRRGVQAGLTALAHYSMLAAPDQPVYAISTEEWKAVKQTGDIIELPGPEPYADQLEIWNYPPKLFAANDVVDRLSLFLSLQDTTDERVESALETMMERMPW